MILGALMPAGQFRPCVSAELVEGASLSFADHYGLNAYDVMAVIAAMPPEFRALLATACGWSAVGEYVAQALGVTGDAFLPNVH